MENLMIITKDILDTIVAAKIPGFFSQNIVEPEAQIISKEGGYKFLRIFQAGHLLDIDLRRYPTLAAAVEYFRYHPNHSFGDSFDLDSDGSVWATVALSPLMVLEMFFINGSFYEIHWYTATYENAESEPEFVVKDGKLVWDAATEYRDPVYRLIDILETETLVLDLEAAYRLGLDPMPTLRYILDEDVDIVKVSNDYDKKEKFFKSTLVIFVDPETGKVSLRFKQVEPDLNI